MDYDLKICGGTIIDGSGSRRYRGDLGIRDGRIVALGDAPGNAKQIIDATGKVVSPGFVDVHTHYDAQILWDRMLTISPWHGVTTVVMGNCGFGVAPTRPEHRELIVATLEKVEGMSAAALNTGLGAEWPFETFPEYMDAIERAGSAINVAVLAGHTPIRLYVMGEESTERQATREEMSAMRKIVDEAMAAGAIGFATSHSRTHIGFKGRKVPSRAADFEEIRYLAGALKERSGVFQATMGKSLWFDEFERISAENDCNVTWTAMLAGANGGPTAYRNEMARSAELIAKGLKIYPQVSCRPLYFEFQFKEPFLFETLQVFQPVAAANLEGKKKIYADPGFRKAFKDKMDSMGDLPVVTRWRNTVISACESHPELDERLMEEVAAEQGVNSIDLALDLALENDLEMRFRMPVANIVEEHVEELLKTDFTVLALSDAGAHASQLCDACMPTYLLGHWVREKGALSLERGIKMLTSHPAAVFGIKDRGLLQVGRPADVVVFDPDRVSAGKLNRVHDLPAGADRLVSIAHGIELVVVNGVILRQNNQDRLDPAGKLPGALLRGGVA